LNSEDFLEDVIM